MYELSRDLGVAQLVARYLGVVEAAGSSPVTQTRKTGDEIFRFLFLSRFFSVFRHGNEIWPLHF